MTANPLLIFLTFSRITAGIGTALRNAGMPKILPASGKSLISLSKSLSKLPAILSKKRISLPLKSLQRLPQKQTSLLSQRRVSRPSLSALRNTMNFSTTKRDLKLSRACLNSRLWPQKEAGCHCFIMPDLFRLRYWLLSCALH